MGAYGTEAVYSSVMPYGDGYAMNQVLLFSPKPGNILVGATVMNSI